MSMINVTTAAASKINELLAEESKPGAGLRVFVQGGGCSGFQYGLMIDEGEGDASTDQVFESNGVRLIIDPISVRYLEGAEVDFVDNMLDLVELQLRAAPGEKLPITQKDVSIKGWSMEARICAEDSSRNFLPSTGLITRYSNLRGRNIRLDSGVEAGSFIGGYYDSLLSKVISWGETREEARTTLVNALNRYHVEGVTTNLNFANSIVNHPAFITGELSTGFIDEHYEGGEAKIAPPVEQLEAMVIAATIVYHNRDNLVRESLKPMAAKVGLSHKPDPWHRYVVKTNDDIFQVELQGAPTSRDWSFKVNGTEYASGNTGF